MHWSTLENYPMDERSLAEILDGGQSFLWNYSDEKKCWYGLIGARLFYFKVSDDSKLSYATEDPNQTVARDEVKKYFGSPDRFMEMKHSLPWRSDAILEKGMQLFPNLVILNQDPELVILSFLCSSNKRIVQIKEMISLLSEQFGQPLAEGVYQAPMMEKLAGLSLDELKACKLGYRAKYVLAVAQAITAKSNFHESIGHMTYEEAKVELNKLQGIGPKVADCILLFAYHKWEAFPVDTWIQKILEDHYELRGYSSKQLLQFAKAHFGKYAGYAQQFLFSYVRHIS